MMRSLMGGRNGNSAEQSTPMPSSAPPVRRNARRSAPDDSQPPEAPRADSTPTSGYAPRRLRSASSEVASPRKSGGFGSILPGRGFGGFGRSAEPDEVAGAVEDPRARLCADSEPLPSSPELNSPSGSGRSRRRDSSLNAVEEEEQRGARAAVG